MNATASRQSFAALGLASVLLAAAIGCSKEPEARPRKAIVEADRVYPLDRSLMNKSGKVIEVKLLGRSDDSIMFRRADDGKGYTFRIDQLYHADQARMRRLPIRPYVFEVPVTKTPLTSQQQVVLRMIEFRKSEAARLQRRLDELKLRLEYDRRTINLTEIERLQNKIAALRNEISEAEKSLKSP